MNAANIKFGIEIETHVPNNASFAIGGAHRGIQVPFLPEGWKAERDCSISTTMPNRRSCEFVSPVLEGKEGVQEVLESVEKIKEAGAKVNHTCGIHITFTFDATDGKALARLLCLVANHETGMYATTGTHRRQNGSYCKSIKHFGNAKRCEDSIKKWNGTYTHERYHVLNLTHLANGKNRIECRIFAASLNATKIAGMIAMILGLVEIAQDSRRAQSWEYKQREGQRGPWNHANRGTGETEVRRMFYRLGWTKGHAKKVYAADVLPEGVTLKEIKKEFIRLAKKYDEAC